MGKTFHGGAMAEITQLGDRVRDVAKGGFDATKDVAGIATEAPEVFDLDGKVQLPLFFEFGPLVFL